MTGEEQNNEVNMHTQFTQEWPSHSLGPIRVCDMEEAHVRNALALIYRRFNDLLEAEGIDDEIIEPSPSMPIQEARSTLNNLRRLQLLGRANQGALTFQLDYLRSHAQPLTATQDCLVQQMVEENLFRPKFT